MAIWYKHLSSLNRPKTKSNLSLSLSVTQEPILIPEPLHEPDHCNLLISRGFFVSILWLDNCNLLISIWFSVSILGLKLKLFHMICPTIQYQYQYDELEIFLGIFGKLNKIIKGFLPLYFSLAYPAALLFFFSLLEPFHRLFGIYSELQKSMSNVLTNMIMLIGYVCLE